jgi:hypothetical protein
MEEINIKEIFNIILENLDDDKTIEIYINLLYDNFNRINYNNFIKELILMLDNSYFIIMFLGKFLDKINLYKKKILKDIIKNTTDITKLKNIFILDVDYVILLEIFILNNLNENDYILLLEWIYEIGKIDIIYKLIEKLEYKLNSIRYNVIFDIIISLIRLHEKLINTDFYIELSKKLIPLIILSITLFELSEFIKNIFLIETNNLFNYRLNTIFNFYRTLIKYKNKYFDVQIINDIVKLINLFIKTDGDMEPYINIIDDLLTLLYINELNIHEKTNLFINITQIITNENINYTPNNLIEYIDYYISNIKFLSWSTLDEKIALLELIAKSLLQIKNKEELYFEKFDNIIFNVLYLEQETFNIFKSVLQTEVIYTNYNLVKNTLYNLLTIINIFNDILIIYFNLCVKYNIYYADLLHKNNLLINIYVNFFNNNNQSNTKFSMNILFQNIIINKFMIIYNHHNYDKFQFNGLEYDLIINYYNNLKINYIHDLDNIINILKEKSIKSNEFIEKYNDDIYIDNIFSIEIIEPIMIPNSEYFYEKATMYLLLRETSQHPYTREKITLNDIIEYNKQSHIKEKINNYLYHKENKLN